METEVAQLTAASGGETMRFEIRAGEPATLGRSSQCTVKLRDPKVSRVHCQLTLAGGVLQVLDLDSSQGLLHRGLSQRQFHLDVGDGFHLGATFVRFEATSTAKAPPTAAATAPRRAPDHDGDRPRAAQRAAGTAIGRFTVGAELGRGARATVYRAQQDGLARAVALKVLDVAGATADHAAERAAFLADARHAAELQAPFLLPVLDGGEVDGACFVAQELVRGSSLAHALGDGRRLPWPKLVPALADVVQALAALHAAGIAHGAVTAGNVFVCDQGGGVLADPRHDAPFEPAADLRALAALAHLALTGEPAPTGLRGSRRVPSLRAIDGSLPPHVDQVLCDLLSADAALPAPTAASVHQRLVAAPTPAAAPAPVAAPIAPSVPAPRAPVIDYPDVEPERARPVSRAPAAKVAAAKLTAQLIVFSIHLVIAIVLLVALKKAGFDLYALFGV